MLQLRAEGGGLRHQPDQPAKTRRQRLPPAGPGRGGTAADPCRGRPRAGRKLGGKPGEACGEATEPRPDQDDQRPGQPARAEAGVGARGDGPAQPRHEQGETRGRGGRGGSGHDRVTNTTALGPGKRNRPSIVPPQAMADGTA
jgi:hypothetical protein